MLVDLDLSILTATSAVGRVHGSLELAVLPRVGERVAFPLAAAGAGGFTGQLTVEHVIHTPGADAKPMVLLSDVIASDKTEGDRLGKSFENSYSLCFDPYEP